ncbi:hypothetical protein PISL3812_07864 [Talaromyces islandicus]|uniref:Uncharacterized protein n=1 Tax=Talaromyces islandicus TaxID=28573 RepID=A0A0U1M5C5_TALIS|nr:hypothetical protein PISL3812_07864 [Talaromyces islandicus]
MVRRKTVLIPTRGVNFSRPSKRPILQINTAQRTPEPLPTSPETPTTTTHTTPTEATTATPDSLPLLTIEEYLHANPPPPQDLRRSLLVNCTRPQVVAYNQRLDAAHHMLFATLHRNLCAFDMFMRYEQGQIFKGKILATFVVHVRSTAKHPWATIKRKIARIFDGLADLFEDGWELIRVEFVVTE